MATGCDSFCVPMKLIIINTVKSIVFSICPWAQSLSGKQIGTGGDNPYLPPEIIINILKRLPVKSILRFQCVCKDWRNLPKSPSFIAEHYDHSVHKDPLLVRYVPGLSRNRRYSPLCLFRYKMETVEVERIPAMKSLRGVEHIIGSSNGLLCVRVDNEKHDPPSSLLLINPATREARQVPIPRNHYGRFHRRAFGFCPVVGDYKIVAILWDRVEVFSLRTGSWKEIDSRVIRGNSFSGQSVIVNGTIFWLEYGRIISFKLSTEVFKLIPLPSSMSFPPLHLLLLVVYENKVGIINQIHARGSYYAHAHAHESAYCWVLEERSDANGMSWEWIKKHGIRPALPFLHPVCSWKNEIAGYNFNPAFLFNLINDNELKFPTSLSAYDRAGRFFHVESLVSMRDMYVE